MHSSPLLSNQSSCTLLYSYTQQTNDSPNLKTYSFTFLITLPISNRGDSSFSTNLNDPNDESLTSSTLKSTLIHFTCSACRYLPSQTPTPAQPKRIWSFGKKHIDLRQHQSDPLALQLDECLRFCLNQNTHDRPTLSTKLCSIQQASQVMNLIHKAELNCT